MMTIRSNPAISQIMEFGRKLRRTPAGLAGVTLVGFWVVVALFAPLLAPFGATQQVVPLQPPGTLTDGGQFFLLGTDYLGRDLLSRIIYGSRTVLTYVPLASLSAYVLGTVMGLVAGYYGGWWDKIISFLSNVILSFPVFVLYLVVIATLGASGFNIFVAITFASAPAIMRIVRGLTLDIRTKDYVMAARTRGESTMWILFREILPNARGQLAVDLCLRLGYVTITIGVLGFLGIGLPPPEPDWGGMVNEARSVALVFPHLILFPCMAISSLILGFNLLADGLRSIENA
jgi:peptide/nickel transport system permease protein